VHLAVLLLILAGMAAAAGMVIAAAYRRGTPRAWNAVAIFAVGLIITAYGGLELMLAHLGTSGSGSRSYIAVIAGLAVAACGLAYGFWPRPR
jgi:hypothetical protein